MASAELVIQYHNFTIWTETKNDVDLMKFLVPDYVGADVWPKAGPPLGIVIPVDSEYGPITVTLDMDGATSAPAPAAERTWSGWTEFLDDRVYVESFDQMPSELNGIALPDGAGRYDVVVEWAYVPRPKDSGTPASSTYIDDPWEKVTVRFTQAAASSGQSRPTSTAQP